jgi:hypothetical protein
VDTETVYELAKALAISEGDMRPIMTRTQRMAYRLFAAIAALVTVLVVDCCRRWGKTRFDVMLAHEEALKGPNRIIRYIAPTKHHGRQFVIPAMEWLFSQVPINQRARWVAQDNTWIWPNGSKCHLGSAESIADAELQVGTECHRAIIDEAGKMRTDILSHLILSVLLPQFATTGGNIYVTSTPALIKAHYLSALVNIAREKESLVSFTIDDCDHIPEAMRLRLILDTLEGISEEGDDSQRVPMDRDAFSAHWHACQSTSERINCIRVHGGPNATVVLREYYCIRITERSRMIIPEWSDVASVCIVETPPALYRDWYVIGDLGFEDMTVIGFIWYDFARAKLIIEHELPFQGASGLAVGYAIKAKEEQLGIKPRRFADGTPQLLADIAHKTLGPGIAFGPVMKDDADAALNVLRMRIAQCHIEVNPRCTTIIAHLENGTWNAGRTSFERIPGFGHFDAIDMLKYAVRAVDWKKNPTPALLPGVSHATHHIPGHIQQQMNRTRDVLRLNKGLRR